MRAFGQFLSKQVLCSLFPLFVFFVAWLSEYFPTGQPRYDVLLVVCILFQWFLVKSGLETLEELRFVTLFHLAGLVLELYKVHHGSWQYPGFAYTKLYEVPLFSGFMYASIASYMIQAWRRFDLRFSFFPDWRWGALVGVAIYLNFFSGRFIGDHRNWIVLAVLAIFGRTRVSFKPEIRPGSRTWRMPMVVSFVLIGYFVWCAEQLCTWLRVWEYPHQVMAWQPVTLSKFGSWCLLVIVSFLLVAWTKRGLECLSHAAFPRPVTEAESP
jgi:uncharacterized membrane protein YoaT (DUF817 family)